MHPTLTATELDSSPCVLALADDQLLHRLSLIAEKTMNAAIVTDTVGRIVWVNAGFTRVTGYQADEVLGKIPGHFLQCPETCAETVSQMRDAVRGVYSFQGKILNQTKDGRRYWLELDIQPIYDARGTHNGFVSIEHDISEQIRMNQALEESSQFLHAALDAMPAKVTILNEKGTILFVNKTMKSFSEQKNLADSEIGIGANFLLAIRNTLRLSLSDAETISTGIQLILNRQSDLFQHDYRIEMGQDVNWFQISVSRFDSRGPTRLAVSIQNITASKQAQEKLESLNQQLKDDVWVLDNARDQLRKTTDYLDIYRKIVDHHAIVAETDTAGTIVSVNNAFCKISGYSEQELLGQNHRLLNSGLHPISFWRDMFKTIAKEGFWHGEICNRNKAGRLYWVDSTIASLRDENGKIRGYFAIRADITSLKEAQAQAEAASRSKSEFLANMSHEIRTPMTAILGYADLLAESCANGLSTETSVEFIDTIKRNGEHLLSIINDVLDISKIEADKMTAEKIICSPKRIVNDVLELMRVKSTAKGLTMETRFEDVPETIITDPTRLRQILVNLVGNAIKFTEIGGVTISVHAVPGQDEHIQFDVIDSGIGLDEAQCSKLFQAFEQADTSMTRKFGGTGLGLRISKRLAQILGGDITVQGKPGMGCVFSTTIATGCTTGIDCVCLLPNSATDTAQEGKTGGMGSLENARPAIPSLTGLRILLAEDGPDNQRLISFHLRKAGAIVEVVENGRLAVEKLSEDHAVEGPLSSPPPVDLVLMDMQMPEMDGYQATAMLRSKGSNLPILALTAHAMDIDLEKCLKAGCNIRLTKPIDKRTLVEACAHWGFRKTQ